MFEIGDTVVYGSNGVCTVNDICHSPFGGGDLRIYYVLKPLDDKASVIYTPAEGGKVVLRPLVSREEAESLLENINNLSEIYVHNEKQRREAYRAAMSKAEISEYVRIIKTVESRRASALVTHRHLAVTDTEFERAAKYCLYNELSIVLGVPFSEVEPMLFGKKE